jgi:hypothetical protein
MMGISSKKQKQVTNQTETATSKPIVAPWLEQGHQAFAGTVSDYLARDPARHVAPVSPLQQQAFDAAASTGTWKPMLEKAAGLAESGAAAPASTVDLGGYAAPRLGAGPSADPTFYAAPTLRAPQQAASESVLAGFDRYLDPNLRHLVGAALAEYDAQAGRDAAALQAQLASSGAFGGSRAGVAQGIFAAESGRKRALTEAELRARAFGQAAQMADADAARRQGANLFNAGAQHQHDLAQFGADADAARHRADAANAAGMFNAGLASQHELARFGAEADAARFAAEAANAEANANAGLAEQALARRLQAAALASQMASAGAANERADIGLAADLGALAREIEAQKAVAPINQLLTGAQLYGAIPVDAYTSRQTDGTTQGITRTKSSPSLFDAALAGAGIASKF